MLGGCEGWRLTGCWRHVQPVGVGSGRQAPAIPASSVKATFYCTDSLHFSTAFLLACHTVPVALLYHSSALLSRLLQMPLKRWGELASAPTRHYLWHSTSPLNSLHAPKGTAVERIGADPVLLERKCQPHRVLLHMDLNPGIFKFCMFALGGPSFLIL